MRPFLIPNYGELLPEEQTLLKNVTVNEAGERVFKLDDGLGDKYSEDQLGEDFVFQVSKCYLGHTLDHDEDLLFET